MPASALPVSKALFPVVLMKKENTTLIMMCYISQVFIVHLFSRGLKCTVVVILKSADRHSGITPCLFRIYLLKMIIDFNLGLYRDIIL